MRSPSGPRAEQPGEHGDDEAKAELIVMRHQLQVVAVASMSATERKHAFRLRVIST